jgi:chloride channel protein, CIC family
VSQNESKDTASTSTHPNRYRPKLYRFLGASGLAERARLGDFTVTARIVPISLIAVAVGLVGAFVAKGLLRFIALFTNIFFYQRFSTEALVPATHHLGAWVIAVPVIGGFIVGMMARYGSERIRGHGIPEAIEAILLRGAKVEPKIAVLKPISAAIAIGSGGPFGAEGPIIMTGGAFGSLMAQFFHLTDAERKTLLVAGAAAGMSATFATPIAAVVLAVELLLFEWKPRSLVPVALASATAAAARRQLLGLGPLFPVQEYPLEVGIKTLLICALMGVMAGILAWIITNAVYTAEDAFDRLPIHWMWWPALGGLAVGIGGYIFPPALGVGYDVIAQLLRGDTSTQLVVGILLVKSTMWALSLGSGTSGGVLAPLLMMGGALGAGAAYFLPHQGAGFWQLVAMAAALAGAMRSPITAIVFAVELTHEMNMFVPLLIACAVAHGFTALTMPRSILTEKLSRRGFHLSREYSVDPLELVFVREVMRSGIVALPATMLLAELAAAIKPSDGAHRGQWLYPVVASKTEATLAGVLTRRELQKLIASPQNQGDETLQAYLSARKAPEVAYPDEPLRAVVYRMAETGLTRFPVVERRSQQLKLLGMISLNDLLKARSVNLEAERSRERVLPLRVLLPRFGAKRAFETSPAEKP